VSHDRFKTLSDIQPQLFPRLHYFARALNSDVFVFRDDVQFVRNHRYPDGTRHASYQIHTPVAGLQGERMLNSQTKGKSILPISQTEVSYEPDWTKKFMNIVDECYRRAPLFSTFRDEIVELFSAKFTTVSQLNIQSTLWGLCRLLGMKYSIGMSLDEVNEQLSVVTSEISMERMLMGSELLASSSAEDAATKNILTLCQVNSCSRYVAGGTAIDSYFELDDFSNAGVTVRRQQWTCEEYFQGGVGKSKNKSFVPNLSILDILAYLPIEEARKNLTDNFHFALPEKRKGSELVTG